jgi:toxin-antitoxin system PIN domain toxin
MGPEQPPARLVDANLVIWAHHEQFAQHPQARRWWAATLTSAPAVGIPWPTILAFVRISTHPRALSRPLDVSHAFEVVEGWLARPNVFVPVPTDRHGPLLGTMLREGKAAGNHSTDAHLAALAVEWGLEVVSADRDFARYPGLRWHDPTATW